MSNEIFGYENNRYFVNSGDSMDRERVLEIFPYARNDGSVGIHELDQSIKDLGELYLVGDTLIMGSVSIRRYVENMGFSLRGSVYTDRHAREIINNMDILEVFPTEKGAPLMYTYESKLKAYMVDYFKAKGRYSCSSSL